jgi:hypothetical protein
MKVYKSIDEELKKKEEWQLKDWVNGIGKQPFILVG